MEGFREESVGAPLGTTVTFAVPKLLLSAWSTAFTTKVCVLPICCGAQYIPVAVMVPVVVLPPCLSLTSQFTAVALLMVLVTVSLN